MSGAPAPRAFSIALRRSSWLTGLGIKSVAPLFIASTTLSGEEAPESMMMGRSRSRTADIPQGLQAVFARHHDIEQHQRDPVPFAFEAGQYLFPILRRLDGVSMTPQSHLEIAADFQFVFAHQDGSAVGAHFE